MLALLMRLLPSALALAAGAGIGPEQPPRCSDPWMDRAVAAAAGRPPRGAGEHGECDLRLYGARWASYDELREQVDGALRALDAAGLEFTEDGSALRDRRSGAAVAITYLGPAEDAPAGARLVPLPRGYVLAARRSPPGQPAPSGAAPHPSPA
ncbi:MAG TPA: hypothetical protein VHG51_14350 [Longimicrobiaceae bacterium]|nr:hypothetical protein [Longimicrobiaceae bacterium]